MTEPSPTTESCAVIAIAAPAGGLTALTALVSRLPPKVHVAAIIIRHVGPRQRNLISETHGRRTPFAMRQGADGDRPQPVLLLEKREEENAR